MKCENLFTDLLEFSKKETTKKNFPKFQSALNDFHSIVGLESIKLTIYLKLKTYILFHLREKKRITIKTNKRKKTLILRRKSPRIAALKKKKKKRNSSLSEEEQSIQILTSLFLFANKHSDDEHDLYSPNNDEDEDDDEDHNDDENQEDENEDKYMFLHTAFLGASGTGKTYLAHKLYALYESVGLVQPNQFKVVTRGALIGKFQGHTTAKVRALIRSAKNGVVFVDEAYALVQNSTDTYGSEALVEIIEAMTSRKTRVSFWFAGYKNDILSKLFGANQGLVRRIDTHLVFTPPTPKNLFAILKRHVEDGFETCRISLANESDDIFIRLIAEFQKYLVGHCSSMRGLYEILKQNAVEKIWQNPKNNQYRVITSGDVRQALNDLKTCALSMNNEQLSIALQHQYGMYS